MPPITTPRSADPDADSGESACGRGVWPDDRVPAPATGAGASIVMSPAVPGGDATSAAASSVRGELDVEGSHRAARLAAGLNACRIAFRCRQVARERWQFSVAPDSLPRLLSLHAEIGAGGVASRPRARRRPPKDASC